MPLFINIYNVWLVTHSIRRVNYTSACYRFTIVFGPENGSPSATNVVLLVLILVLGVVIRFSVY